jgi:uncharacterized membrane protein
MMTKKERLFHAILYEVSAIICVTVLGTLVTGKETITVAGLSIALASIAMCWNYVFNIIFDRFYGTERLKRTLKVRVFHSSCFEVGLMALTLPVMMVVLNMAFWKVFALNVGAMIFFFIFTIVFNWVYDIAAAKLKKSAAPDEVNAFPPSH